MTNISNETIGADGAVVEEPKILLTELQGEGSSNDLTKTTTTEDSVEHSNEKAGTSFNDDAQGNVVGASIPDEGCDLKVVVEEASNDSIELHNEHCDTISLPKQTKLVNQSTEGENSEPDVQDAKHCKLVTEFTDQVATATPTESEKVPKKSESEIVEDKENVENIDAPLKDNSIHCDGNVSDDAFRIDGAGSPENIDVSNGPELAENAQKEESANGEEPMAEEKLEYNSTVATTNGESNSAESLNEGSSVEEPESKEISPEDNSEKNHPVDSDILIESTKDGSSKNDAVAELPEESPLPENTSAAEPATQENDSPPLNVTTPAEGTGETSVPESKDLKASALESCSTDVTKESPEKNPVEQSEDAIQQTSASEEIGKDDIAALTPSAQETGELVDLTNVPAIQENEDIMESVEANIDVIPSEEPESKVECSLKEHQPAADSIKGLQEAVNTGTELTSVEVMGSSPEDDEQEPFANCEPTSVLTKNDVSLATTVEESSPKPPTESSLTTAKIEDTEEVIDVESESKIESNIDTSGRDGTEAEEFAVTNPSLEDVQTESKLTELGEATPTEEVTKLAPVEPNANTHSSNGDEKHGNCVDGDSCAVSKSIKGEAAVNLSKDSGTCSDGKETPSSDANDAHQPTTIVDSRHESETPPEALVEATKGEQEHEPSTPEGKTDLAADVVQITQAQHSVPSTPKHTKESMIEENNSPKKDGCTVPVETRSETEVATDNKTNPTFEPKVESVDSGKEKEGSIPQTVTLEARRSAAGNVIDKQDQVETTEDEDFSYEEEIVEEYDEEVVEEEEYEVEYVEEYLEEEEEEEELAEELTASSFTEVTYNSQDHIMENLTHDSSPAEQGTTKRIIVKSATQKKLEREEARKRAEAEETRLNMEVRLARQNSFAKKDEELKRRLAEEEERHIREEEEREQQRIEAEERLAQIRAQEAATRIAQQQTEELRRLLEEEEKKRKLAEAEARRLAAENAAREKAEADRKRREAEEAERNAREEKRRQMEEEVRLLQEKLAEAKRAAEAARQKQIEEKKRLQAMGEPTKRKVRKVKKKSKDMNDSRKFSSPMPLSPVRSPKPQPLYSSPTKPKSPIASAGYLSPTKPRSPVATPSISSPESKASPGIHRSTTPHVQAQSPAPAARSPARKAVASSPIVREASPVKSVAKSPKTTPKPVASPPPPKEEPAPAAATSSSGGGGPYYSPEQLRKQSVPGLDYKNREIYLSDDDFLSVFGVTKEEFDTYPKWKKTNLKRKKKMF